MRRGQEVGTVSVYFITATAAFVLLTALLIDFSRIAAFRYHVELAMQAGVRSVLSSFDPVLYARYGLFVRGGEDATELLKTTTDGHFDDSRGGGGFSYLQAEFTSIDVTESRPLADHDVFRRQVMEEMKYKAPVDLALELADRFRGVSPALKEAAATVDMLEKMRKAYERREAALDEAVEIQQSQGMEAVSLIRELAPFPPVSTNGTSSLGHVRHTADAALQYEDYVARSDEDAASDYESGVVSLAASLATAAGSIRSSSDQQMRSAKQAWMRAEAANDEMSAIAREAAASPRGGETPSDRPAGSGQEVEQGKVESIAELRQTAEQLLLDDSFFRDLSAELDTQRSRSESLSRDADRFSALASSIPGSTGMGGRLRDAASRLQTEVEQFSAAYGNNGSVIRNRRAVQEMHRSRDGERKAEERKAKSEWAGLSGLLGALSGRQGSQEARESFLKVKELERENLEWNRASDSPERSDLPGDPSNGRERAMSGAAGLMDVLEGSLTGTRDQLFFSEYAIQRLSRFPPQEVKRMLDGEEVSLSPENQETEFILYGLNNPAGNVAAAYGEIISLRLAIRTMEGLIECRAMGHPLVVLAAALVYGIRQTLQDIHRLLERDSVPLSKYVNVETSYADYLRLFLLIHGGSSGQTARSIAVMERATGVSFSKAYTYVSGDGIASLRLWFFPGLLKVLGQAGQLGGTVKGNRYEAAYTADSSYQ